MHIVSQCSDLGSISYFCFAFDKIISFVLKLKLVSDISTKPHANTSWLSWVHILKFSVAQ